MPLPAAYRRPVLRCRLSALTLFSNAVAACRSDTSAVAPGERELVLEVAASRAPCVAVGPRECLQVRERADAPWQLFYGDIEGFTYEPGWWYVLRVARRSVPNPPADGSSVAYRLVRVVAKTPSS
jgi:hypothetical protein